MKQASFIILALLLLFLPACASEAETTVSTLPVFPEDAVEIGTSGYFCVTGVSEAVDVIDTENTRRMQVFAHQIFDPETEYIVTLTSTVTGEHNQEEDTASITEVVATLSNAAVEGLTASGHVSKNTATIVLYWNQQSVCHFQYRLYPNGSMEIL